MFTIAGRQFDSHLMIGTGKFPSNESMKSALEASESQIITVALRRVDLTASDDILSYIDRNKYLLLPNTSGAKDANEALMLARLAREAGLGNWIKLELVPEPRYLLPDPLETFTAAKMMVDDGFIVLPYMNADPILALRLADIGCAAVMPLGSPIGSGRGIKTKDSIKIIIEQASVPVVVDAGIGAPSHAAEAMEMGADAVLVNTAIAAAGDPISMAIAFKDAVSAGKRAFESGMLSAKDTADASSPLTGFLGE